MGGLGSFVAEAQGQVRDFTEPILVLNSGGHHATIRSLVFTPDGRQLLSGGLDKVVNVWGLQDGRPTLDATIRPPIWRGPAGIIYAMALSPTADERGQRVLAVAGYGVESRHGNIGLFHFPGTHAIKTGDHFAQLLRDDPNEKNDPNNPRPTGHADTVMSLAFNPGGTLLASGSIDSTARIWDWKNRRTTAILRDHVGAINALAFTPAGTHLITGGRDGTLRLWDINRPDAPVARADPPASNAADPIGVQINALAISDDGRWVVIGREDGRVIRYDAATLGNERVLPANEEGTIESLALSHNGARLVTSSIPLLKTRSELPRLTCSIQVRSMPDGGNPRKILELDNIAHACGFSPDDRTMAVAGGDRQGIFLITNWDGEPSKITKRDLKGQGRSIWDVGLRDDRGGPSIGFSHEPDQNLWYPPRQAPRVNPRYRGMILPGRELTDFDAAELSRGLLEFQGWKVDPVDQFNLRVSRADRPERTFTIALDEVKDRRWKCYSFIPGGPKHEEPTVAVGCESGVWFFRLKDGQPTRLFSGHSGPVYCLAPSKDGRWLATGSSDQTVRLWTLAGCDTVPNLGAEFDRLPDGTRVVKEVAPLSFAEAMGLRKGDVPRKFVLGGKFVSEVDFFARFESQLPNTQIALVVRRKVEPAKGPPVEEEIPLATTRRDHPALSLFLGEDREWVVWMPSGFYDTSIAGDTRLLGWHLNQATIFQPRPTDFLEIIKFEKQFRQPWRIQPNRLDTLLETGELRPPPVVPPPPPGLPPPPPPPAPPVIVERGQPPVIVLEIKPLPNLQVTTLDGKPIDTRDAPPEKIAFDGLDPDGKGTLILGLKIDSEGRSPINSLEYRVDGRPIRLKTAFDRPLPFHKEDVTLPALDPGPHRFTAVAVNQSGVDRIASLDIFVRGRPRPRTTRLKVLALAPAFRDKRVPPIPFAERDIKDLRRFFAKHLVAPGGGPLKHIDDDLLIGHLATVEEAQGAFRALQRQDLSEGDLVVVVIESHFVNYNGVRMISAADGGGLPPFPGIPADELAMHLGEVAKYKCKVLVLLDALHPGWGNAQDSKAWYNDFNDWVRHLRDDQNVITFVASNSGLSQPVAREGHRAFAQAVLDSVRQPSLKDGPYLMDDFRDIVIEGVLKLTGRQQQAACYVPGGINGQFPILDPQPTGR